MVTGIDLIRAIQAFGEQNVRNCAAALDREAGLVARIVLDAHSQGPEDTLALAKVLRNRNAFLRPDLQLDFPWLTKNLINVVGQKHINTLDELASRAHQARTQAAYLSAMLRPFDPKYLYLWLNERKGLDSEAIQRRLSDLENMQIRRIDSVIEWGDLVADQFRDLVVVEDEDSISPRRRPFGTISDKSSRTYLQSWNAFIRRNCDNLLEPSKMMALAKSQGSEPPSRKSEIDTRLAVPRKLSRSANSNESTLLLQTGAGGYATKAVQSIMSEAAAELQKALDENRRLKEGLQNAEKLIQEKIDKEIESAHVSNVKPGLEIFAVTPSGQEASCYFRDMGDVEQGIENWVEALKLMWGGEAVSAAFRAQLRNESAQMAFALPKWTLGEASGKLSHFTAKISGKTENSVSSRSSKA